MNHGIIAALVRGLCIDKSKNGKPQIVIYQKWDNEAPANAMKFDIDEIFLNNEKDDTDESKLKLAAEKIRSSYEDWKNSLHNKEENKTPVPSCAALLSGKKTIALFWIGSDYDSAKKKLEEKNGAPFFAEYETKKIEYPGAAQRGDVVKNKIALITGGAQGIGEEIARNLAAAGALVFIADINLEGAQKLAHNININENRTAAFALEANVSSEESAQSLINSIAITSGGLDLCVSNAGVLKAGSVLEQELSDFKFVTDINYTGFFVICKFAGRLLRAQHMTSPAWKTDIIQINSKSGLEGSNKNGAYSGGKYGGIGLVASFAMELIEYGIKVNAVCPGNFLDGPLWSHPERGLFVQYLRNGKVPGAKNIADVRAFYESKVPMKRGCTGIDLVRAIFYIVEQEYETGQAVPVTGGQIMLH